MVRGFARQPVQIVSAAQAPAIPAALVPAAHVKAVQHRSTRLTLATREFQADVQVGGKDVARSDPAPGSLRAIASKLPAQIDSRRTSTG